MMLTLAIAILTGGAFGLVVALILTPRIVEYVETTTIDAPAAQVYDSIRRQRDVMRWSAWPSETGARCDVVGEDGVVGAQIVYLDKKGRRFGAQTVIDLAPQRRIAFTLESKGPPHKPAMRFHLIAVAPDRTDVVMHFRNAIAPPFHVALRVAGVVRWTRAMHRKDLDGLKRFVERAEDYDGAPAG